MGNHDGKWGFSMFMSEAITEFGFDCKIRKLSPKTIPNYQKQLKYLQRYLDSEFGVKEVDAIKSIHIKQFLAMKDDQGRKARYIRQVRSSAVESGEECLDGSKDWRRPVC